MFSRLISALNNLAAVLSAADKTNQSLLGWLKSHSNCLTLRDLKEMEERLTKAIAESAKITPAVESAAIRLGAALDKLDAQIPDKRRNV